MTCVRMEENEHYTFDDDDDISILYISLSLFKIQVSYWHELDNLIDSTMLQRLLMLFLQSVANLIEQAL